MLQVVVAAIVEKDLATMTEREFRRRVAYLDVGDRVAWGDWTVERGETSLFVWDASGRKTRFGGNASYALAASDAFGLIFGTGRAERVWHRPGVCNVKGCDCPRCPGNNLCYEHRRQYNNERYRLGATTLVMKSRSEKISPLCKVEGCGKPKRKKSGYCLDHYRESQRNWARRNRAGA